MCRDEQMFSSYYDEMQRQRAEAAANASSNQSAGSKTSKTTKCRKFSPVGDVHNKDDRRLADEADMLQDVANAEVRDIYSDDEDEEPRRRSAHVVNRSFVLTAELPQFSVRDILSIRDFFREVLQQYGVMSKRHVHIKVNDDTRLRSMCRGADGECTWFVYLHKGKNGDYVVQTLNRKHINTCSEVQENKWIMSKWLGKQFTKKIKANPHIPLVAIRQCVDEQLGSRLSRMKAYKAKGHVLEGIFGDIEKQYKKLFYYKNELLRTHPGSNVQIHYENHRRTPTSSPRFLIIYICLGPLKIGWIRLCQPIIFIDACFLRGSYKGQILTAIGIDQNNGWWPLAWSVCETESMSNGNGY